MNMTQPSRDAMRPRFAENFPPPLKQRAQGRPGARCTRGLVCNVHKKCAHEHTGPAESIRPSLRNGFTAYGALSPVRPTLLPPSLREIIPQSLTPASGRQDHTILPYAQATLVSRSSRVHRISPHVRNDREPPLLSGETARFKALICPTSIEKYF